MVDQVWDNYFVDILESIRTAQNYFTSLLNEKINYNIIIRNGKVVRIKEYIELQPTTPFQPSFSPAKEVFFSPLKEDLVKASQKPT